MKLKIKRVLMVCSGNTARSPAAEYLGKYYAKKLNADLEFDSAGFFNAFTYMQPESQEYLNKKGINHSDFRPKILNRALLEKADLILTMEQYHVEQILRSYGDLPNIKEKTFTIKEFNSRKGDIIDPYYTSRSIYQKVMKELDSLIKETVKKIIKINQNDEKT
ncbi:MAG: arsenate reductase/protein-tyrosine-phosphatase family protein [Promethearchaeota archaeon]